MTSTRYRPLGEMNFGTTPSRTGVGLRLDASPAQAPPDLSRPGGRRAGMTSVSSSSRKRSASQSMASNSACASGGSSPYHSGRAWRFFGLLVLDGMVALPVHRRPSLLVAMGVLLLP